jgi:hypothetical protein
VTLAVPPIEYEIRWEYEPDLERPIHVFCGDYYCAAKAELVEEVGLFNAVLMLAAALILRIEWWRNSPRLRWKGKEHEQKGGPI